MKIEKAGFLLAAVILSGVFIGCGNKEAEESKEPVETVVSVNVSKPARKDISLSYNFSGTVQAEDTVVVMPKVAGEVTEKHFEVGDHVNAGDLLFKIDDTSAQIGLKQAEAQLSSAQAGLNSQVAAQASTYASATETLGKIPTNEQQLGTAVDSAYASAVQAGAQKDTANASSDYAKQAYESATKELENAISARDVARNNLVAAQASGDEDALAAAKTALDSAERNVATAENAKNQAELQKKTNENSAKSAEMQYYVAVEGYDMAVRNKSDYETYTKSTTLYGANAQMVGADAALTNSKASLEQAKAGVDNAKLALEYTQVTSPVSGIITAINVSEHNMASQQTQAYTIQSQEKGKVVFYVAEETKKNITPGNDALVTKNGTDYHAQIYNVEDTIDPSTGLFKVEARVGEGADELINGSVVNVRTITREAKNAVSVPVNCVYYDAAQAYVYVAENKTAVRKNIVTGLSDEKDIEVKEGLGDDDDVILTYSAQMKDGVKVDAKQVKE